MFDGAPETVLGGARPVSVGKWATGGGDDHRRRLGVVVNEGGAGAEWRTSAPDGNRA